jgi:hypothetical protein
MGNPNRREAFVIPVDLKNSIRVAVISLGMALGGTSLLGAAAQNADEARIDEVDPGQPVANAVIELAGWVIATDNHRGYPFAIIDKKAAQVLIFGADGKLKGLAPVLIGSAVGDHSAPGVGDRELKDIPMNDRTTPAGRFIAGYGPATGGQRVLWVDYEAAVSIHPISTGNRAEKREERLASPKPDDNRITHGCLNVSQEFYDKIVRTTFAKGGVFYVLPDNMTMDEAFPGFGNSNLAMSVVGAFSMSSLAEK